MAAVGIAGERGGIPQIEFAWLQIAIVRLYEVRPGSGPLMADSLPYLPRLSFGICLLSDSIDACNKQISICRRAAYVRSAYVLIEDQVIAFVRTRAKVHSVQRGHDRLLDDQRNFSNFIN